MMKLVSTRRLSFSFYFFFIALAVLFVSCDETSNKGDGKDSVTSEKVQQVSKAPVFNADSAYFFVEKQVSFGPRIPNTIPHVKCADYLAQFMRKNGAVVIEQDFQAKTFDQKLLRSKNIIASINPAAKKRILLAAHWDTRPWSDEDETESKKTFDGANDGGSGVGVLMEVIRVINASADKPTIGIDIILFDAEDYGKSEFENSYCLGSQYWAKNKHTPNYAAFYGILLDMVGAKDAQFYFEGVSMKYAPSVVKKVWSKAVALGYGNLFIQQGIGSITDDHLYVNEIGNIPMIDIIDYSPNRGFGDSWHTQKDNMQVIDKSTLKAVGQTLLEVVYQEN